MNKKRISIAIPAWNEEQNIPDLLARLEVVISSLKETYEFEVIICDNGSSDNTFQLLKSASDHYPWLKWTRLSRNFHMEGGMMAAISHATGDACIIMSADLQDPPELIPKMIDLWALGNDHVYTVITYRHGESWFRRQAAEIFYWMINKLSETPVPRNASDFRLVSRQMYEIFNSMPEKDRMVRAIWGWMGFTSANIEYERPARRAGKSSFNPFITGGFAVRGLLATSRKPLKAIPIFGLFLSSLSFLGLLASAGKAIWDGVPFPGYGTIVSVILLLFGVLFMMLAVLAEYIGMIYVEVRSRPAFIELRPDQALDTKEGS